MSGRYDEFHDCRSVDELARRLVDEILYIRWRGGGSSRANGCVSFSSLNLDFDKTRMSESGRYLLLSKTIRFVSGCKDPPLNACRITFSGRLATRKKRGVDVGPQLMKAHRGYSSGKKAGHIHQARR